MKLPVERKRTVERLYWGIVALMALAWTAGLVDGIAPNALGRLGPVGDVAMGLGVFVFPGFMKWLVPGVLLDSLLESREAAERVWLLAKVVYAVLVAATALWFGLSRQASLRLRAAVMVVLIVAGPLGYVASLPLTGNVVAFAFINLISGGGYYEWKAAKDAAEQVKDPPPASSRSR
jgi:hypothetical protein